VRRIILIAAVFAGAVMVLVTGRLAGRMIRGPEITYSWPYGALYAYDVRFGLSAPIMEDFGQFPVAWSWSPDGARLAYVLLDEQGVYHLYLWSPLTRRVVSVTDGLPFGSPPQWSPDGEVIAAVNASQDICLYPVGGGAPRCLNVQPAGQPVWSPDGASIAYVSRLPQGGLSRVDIATGEVTTLFTGAEDLTHPRWSPDGAQIAFSYAPQPEGLRHLYLVAASGGAVKALTGGSSEQDQPVWSPDGRLIAYINDPVESRFQADIAIVNIETGKITPVTSHPMNDADPRWSPDGAWLAFVTDRHNSAPSLVIVPANGLDDVEPLNDSGVPMRLYAYAWRP
jgi:Tol biopolymer transport system component